MTNLRTHWQPVTRLRHNTIPSRLLDSLLHTGSLTRYLERWCDGRLRLCLQNQSWQKPLTDEAMALDLAAGRYALVREITFNCADIPWVYGRSILPAKTISGAERRLAFWGQRSLGSYLFSSKDILRGRIEVARIRPDDKLHVLALEQKADPGTTAWGRRSVFYIRGKPLLVVEVFLDSAVKCMTNTK